MKKLHNAARTVPKCVVCGTLITPLWQARKVPVHSTECAVLLVERLIAAEPCVLDLLPAQYRADHNEDAHIPQGHSRAPRARTRTEHVP